MDVERAISKIRCAMEELRQLACEEPPDNGMTFEQLMDDTEGEFDNGSHVGQWAYLLLRDALDALKTTSFGQAEEKSCPKADDGEMEKDLMEKDLVEYLSTLNTEDMGEWELDRTREDFCVGWRCGRE